MAKIATPLYMPAYTAGLDFSICSTRSSSTVVGTRHNRIFVTMQGYHWALLLTIAAVLSCKKADDPALSFSNCVLTSAAQVGLHSLDSTQYTYDANSYLTRQDNYSNGSLVRSITYQYDTLHKVQGYTITQGANQEVFSYTAPNGYITRINHTQTAAEPSGDYYQLIYSITPYQATSLADTLLTLRKHYNANGDLDYQEAYTYTPQRNLNTLQRQYYTAGAPNGSIYGVSNSSYDGYANPLLRIDRGCYRYQDLTTFPLNNNNIHYQVTIKQSPGKPVYSQTITHNLSYGQSSAALTDTIHVFSSDTARSSSYIRYYHYTGCK